MAVEVGHTISFNVPKDVLGSLLEGKELILDDEDSHDSLGIDVREIVPRKDHLEITGVVLWIGEQ